MYLLERASMSCGEEEEGARQRAPSQDPQDLSLKQMLNPLSQPGALPGILVNYKNIVEHHEVLLEELTFLRSVFVTVSIGPFFVSLIDTISSMFCSKDFW